MPVCFILNPGKWHSFDYKKKNEKIGHLFSRRTVLLNILIAADEVRPTDEQTIAILIAILSDTAFGILIII